jgi:hypothetical protein
MGILNKKFYSDFIKTGLVISLCGIVIWLPLYLLVYYDVINRYSPFAIVSAYAYFLLPFIIVIVKGRQHLRVPSCKFEFSFWVSTLFSNYVVSYIILFSVFIPANIKIDKSSEIFMAPFFIMFLIIGGLFLSLFTTLMLRKD